MNGTSAKQALGFFDLSPEIRLWVLEFTTAQSCDGTVGSGIRECAYLER